MGAKDFTVCGLAEWSSGLSLRDVPERVMELCRAQRRSILGAVAASHGNSAVGRITEAVAAGAPPGPAPLVGRGEEVAVEAALYTAAVHSVALDYDDYLCFGHTGHSAVLVPVLLASETRARAAEQLLAQVVANEVGARLGGACLFGPLNGQMWSFIHSAGAALAASKLFGLDAERTAHALAIALAQPPRATTPGFFCEDTKLILAAEPALSGLRAARLAACGGRGPLGVLDDDEGFFAAFASAPLRGMLSGLGEAWASLTLSVKPQPGCAYLQTVLDALRGLGRPEADEVDHVTVEVNALTAGMELLSTGKGCLRRPSLIDATFSVRWAVAIYLVAGEYGPAQLREEWLEANRNRLAEVASKVRMVHDWDLTREAITGLLPLLPLKSIAQEIGLRSVALALRDRRRSFAKALRPRAARETLAVMRLLKELVGSESRRFWDAAAVEDVVFRFPVRVDARVGGGRVRVACASHRGSVGHRSVGPVEAAREKLRTEATRVWGLPAATALDRAIEDDADELWQLLG